MGGKDVVSIKQLQNSNLQPIEVQKKLKQLADERFSEDVNGNSVSNTAELSGKLKVQTLLNSASPLLNGGIAFTLMTNTAIKTHQNDELLGEKSCPNDWIYETLIAMCSPQK